MSYEEDRERMVRQIADYTSVHKVRDPRVLEAMRKVPRHEFVPPEQAPYAYEDHPLPIGAEQTISQPFMVAFMVEALEPKPGQRVLEVGVGSGYQAAVLAELVGEVFAVEIVGGLARGAASTLERLGYRNVHVRAGDGYLGWPEHAPYDAIVVSCSPDHVPRPLIDQLKDGGRLVIPLGGDGGGLSWGAQELVLGLKTPEGLERTSLMDVRFVPMTGEARTR